MVRNDFYVDIRLKCLEEKMTQKVIAYKMGVTGSFVNKVIRERSDMIVSSRYAVLVERLGWDIELRYVKRDACGSGQGQEQGAEECRDRQRKGRGKGDMLRNNTREDLMNMCSEKGLTLSELAAMAGMQPTDVVKVLNNSYRTVVGRAFQAICEALGYDIELVYVKRDAENGEEAAAV